MRDRAPPDRFRRLDEDSFDAIVVGAGIGGLTAAALMARQGVKVLVLDQHYVAGGNASTFHRPGYEFDIGLHYVGDAGPFGALTKVLRATGVEDIEFNPMDIDGFDTLVFPDLTFRVPRGLKPYAARLRERFPSEVEGINRYIAFLEGFRSAERIASDFRRAPRLVSKLWPLLRSANSTVTELLDQCTLDPRLRAVLIAQNGNYAQPPSRASALLHGLVMWHYLKDGGYYPRGGGQIISARLAEEIEGHGGKLLLGTRVEKVVVRRGAVEGVTFQNKHLGRRFARAPHVVSNADYRQTLLRLVGRGHLSGRAYGQARDAEMSPALGIVFLGIKRDLAAEGIPNTNFWVYPGREIESGYQEVAEGAMPERPMAYVSMASLKDPDNPALAPPGRANLQLMSLAPAGCESWGLSPAEVQAGTYHHNQVYRTLKERYADRLIERAEQVLPGLRRDIELCVVATPVTHNRYTLASGGTPYGLALTPGQFGFHRPGVSTEISGLYLCGASCKTSHGILGCMMSGVLAASKVAGSAVTRAVFNRAFGGAGQQPREDLLAPSGT